MWLNFWPGWSGTTVSTKDPRSANNLSHSFHLEPCLVFFFFAAVASLHVYFTFGKLTVLQDDSTDSMARLYRKGSCRISLHFFFLFFIPLDSLHLHCSLDRKRLYYFSPTFFFFHGHLRHIFTPTLTSFFSAANLHLIRASCCYTRNKMAAYGTLRLTHLLRLFFLLKPNHWAILMRSLTGLWLWLDVVTGWQPFLRESLNYTPPWEGEYDK